MFSILLFTDGYLQSSNTMATTPCVTNCHIKFREALHTQVEEQNFFETGALLSKPENVDAIRRVLEDLAGFYRRLVLDIYFSLLSTNVSIFLRF